MGPGIRCEESNVEVESASEAVVVELDESA